MKTFVLALSLVASLAAPSAFQTRITGHGRPMILIPGLSSGGGTWDSTVEHFQARFECHVVTVAGFGGVPRTSTASPMLDGIVDDLAKYIRDLLLLDIQMPGMSGFELLERLEHLPQVIFTTAYDEYAIKAFEVNALDYLLKPVTPERLGTALERMRPTETRAPLEQVFVRDGERCWIVRLPEISLLESEGNYTRVHFRDESPLIRRTLNALEERLDADAFFRANRAQIINLKWIDQVDIAVAGGLVVTLRRSHDRDVASSIREAARDSQALEIE